MRLIFSHFDLTTCSIKDLFVAKTKSFCAKQSSKFHTGKINLSCLRRQLFRMMDMLHLNCLMNQPYYDKIT